MKVLVITYYWPPSGGSGVQRWLKFVKYFPSLGVKPYVFTPENPSFDILDQTLLKDIPPEAEVIHFPIWEPYHLFGRNSNSAKLRETNVMIKKKSFGQKLFTWLRGNLLFPDPRVFWVRPSVVFLDKFLREKDIGLIITTGPPHSVHLIGLKLKKKNPSIQWVADFRDPWSEWGTLRSFNLTPGALKIHQSMERKVLTKADRVITVTPFYARQLEKLSGRKVEVFTNGFDEDDFKDLKMVHANRCIIRHVGIVRAEYDLRLFMQAMEELLREHPFMKEKIVIDFTGVVHDDFKSLVASRPDLQTIIRITPQVPHKELIRLYGESSALLLIITGYRDAEGFIPGKVFEYIATRLPLIAIGPTKGDVAELLKQANADQMIDCKDKETMKRRIFEVFLRWELKSNDIQNTSSVSGYSRRVIAERFFESVVEPINY